MEDLVPRRRERLVLCVRHDPVVAKLDDAERVRLAADVGRGQPLRLEDLDHQVAHVLHLVEGVGGLLAGIIYRQTVHTIEDCHKQAMGLHHLVDCRWQPMAVNSLLQFDLQEKK